VVIAGGGIVGCLSGYLPAKEGVKATEHLELSRFRSAA
jgi:glycine/D-amino acid oxidase-like deaminating enzyme